MSTFMLVIMLFSANGQHGEQIVLSGFGDKFQCSNVEMWMDKHPFVTEDDGVTYKIAAMECTRQRTT